MRSIRKSFFSPHRPIDKSIDTYVLLCELSSHWALIFCSAQIWANLTPGADKNKYSDLLTGKVYCVLMLVKRSTLQRLRDRSRFFVNSAVRRSYVIRYMNNLYQRSNRRAFLRARCLICILKVLIMAESTTDEHRPEGYDEDFVEAVDQDL